MPDATLSQISPATLRAYRDEAAELARLGGAELRPFFGSGIESRLKTSGRDLVTEADLASERVILSLVEQRHPEHGWQSEEAGTRPGASPLRWVIDPLDGTANFAHGYPHYGVSVALMHGARSLAGAVYDPLRDECFAAAMGEGATLNGVPIAVSMVTSLGEALVSTGFPYEPPARRTAMANVTARAIERVQMLRRSGSAALDCAYVAAGRQEAHYEFYLSLHDVAAGLLLVTEAGGLAEEMTYADWPLGHIASNGSAIRDAIAALLREFLGEVELRPAAAVAEPAP
jgi:myo-inositol-1(or 4)-monophosphatase